ncbi:hypothetical protein [Thermosediminibacter oceani]|uniref:Lipoprotein n=1 Tax=Thermosediminibacter oceani (strain ATCC BAA-1034 / DSM 16646 / JW/IW-1228P) TaxID=555079 RepID=D9RZX9_THEOJ|nr:hypothetical protein [Thermosediminibacter oceani]ADL08756.1 hypothetical protein Toce_2038 [Thermosediminibacter oceani DSM 16646]
MIKKIFIYLLAFFVTTSLSLSGCTKEKQIFFITNAKKIEIRKGPELKVVEDKEDIVKILNFLNTIKAKEFETKEDINGWIYSLKIYLENDIKNSDDYISITFNKTYFIYNNKYYEGNYEIVKTLDDIFENVNK